MRVSIKMRYIQKKLHHSSKLDKLSRAHVQRTPTTKDEARKLWGNLDKQGILDLLLFEQYGLCCYSEIRADVLGFDYHIEHVENKSQNPARTFDYTNLLASAFHSDKLGLYRDIFGGHAHGKSGRDSIVNMSLFISPLQTDCASFFTYTSDGKINPNPQLNDDDAQKAKYTIDILNLNSPELVTRREALWLELDENLLENFQSGRDIKYWLEIEMLPDGHNKLESFFSLKRQFFGGLEISILRNYKNGELL